MSFWSGETLRKRLPSIVRKPHYSEDRIDCNAYTMRLGEEIYVSPSRKKAVGGAKVKLESRSGRAIPPGQFAFLLTEEYVEIPQDAMAFISMRSTQKFQGLVNVSGFHVDPGYRGHLVFAVFNASANYIHLHRGDSCFLMWFANLDEKSAPPYTKTHEGFIDIPSKIVNPLGSGKIESLAGLSERINSIESNLKVIGAVVLISASVVMTATIGQCRAAAGQDPLPSSPQAPAASVVPASPPVSPPETQPSLQPTLTDSATQP